MNDNVDIGDIVIWQVKSIGKILSIYLDSYSDDGVTIESSVSWCLIHEVNNVLDYEIILKYE